MKKQLVRRITNTLLAAGLCLLPMVGQGAESAASTSQMEALVAGKFAVVGSIADLAELRSTLAYLESVGMKGAFIVSAREAKQYPENVKLIVKYGHSIILEMQGKRAELKSAAGVEQSKPAKPKVEAEIVQAPPLIIGHTGVEEPSFRERAAKGRAQKAEAQEQAELSKKLATKEAVAKPAEPKVTSQAKASRIMEPKTTPKVRESKVALANPLNVKTEKTAVKEKKDITDLHNPPEGKPALKSVGTDDARNVKIERPKMTKKQRVARDFFGVDENGRKVGLRYPGTAKHVDNVPDWSLAALTKLSGFGLLSPTELRGILSEPNRELM
ncbi:MAG: hypothetical protein ACI3XC_05710, partial [Phascolarctobacterium sp.]